MCVVVSEQSMQLLVSTVHLILILLHTCIVTGACPDYRWYYDGRSPSCTDLQAVLTSTTNGILHLPNHLPHQSSSSTRSYSTGPTSSRSTGPLLPHVCSLALLPSSAQGLLAYGVRHLMVQGSPVYDIYYECPVRNGLPEGMRT